MSTKNDGGAAFPVAHSEDANGAVRQWGETGMSLRDWFAGQALGECIRLAAGDDYEMNEESRARGLSLTDALAHQAYAFADALLKARGGDQ